MNNLPLVLLILDGFGLAEPGPGNAITQAHTPNFDHLWQTMPHAELQASGLAVGLPEGQIGNSEVGHLNIGAGRIVKQSLVEINDAIADGQLEANTVLQEAFEMAKQRGRIHFVGLASEGGVHSHLQHLVALLKLAKQAGVPEAFVQAMTDGRDSAPTSGLDAIQELHLAMLQMNFGQIASISGRFYGMDRDQRWERTAEAYRAMVAGNPTTKQSAEELLEQSYASNITDEFLKPVNLIPSGTIESDDVVICFNFRPDRMRQLVHCFEQPDQIDFVTEQTAERLSIFTMTQYSLESQAKVIMPKEILKKTLGEVLSSHSLRQYRLAETEKYAHVTYFMNGGIDQIFKNEQRLLVPSPKVATYDMQPEMSVEQITDAAVQIIEQNTSDVLIINFANCDMVGHSADLRATIKAVEAVDQSLGRIWQAVQAKNGALLVTADHGNAEQLLSQQGSAYTAHTTNPVPLIVAGAGQFELKSGKLGDIAPTILELINIKQPSEMTGESLIL